MGLLLQNINLRGGAIPAEWGLVTEIQDPIGMANTPLQHRQLFLKPLRQTADFW